MLDGAFTNLDLVMLIVFVVIGMGCGVFATKYDGIGDTVLAMIFGGLVSVLLGFAWDVSLLIVFIIVAIIFLAKFSRFLIGKYTSTKVSSKDYELDLVIVKNSDISIKTPLQKINKLRESPYSKGMLLDEYEKEIVEIVKAVGILQGDGDKHSRYSIPSGSWPKFIQVIRDFEALVEHAEKEILRLESESMDRLNELNNQKLEQVSALLKSIKEDKLKGKV